MVSHGFGLYCMALFVGLCAPSLIFGMLSFGGLLAECLPCSIKASDKNPNNVLLVLRARDRWTLRLVSLQFLVGVKLLVASVTAVLTESWEVLAFHMAKR